MSVVHKCDTCKAKTKPQPVPGMVCELGDTIPDSWGMARHQGRIYTVCPDCWGWWKR